ncbi:MAG: hypothetical protein J6O90_05870 [Candidatus Methanomethylophilaceae archaeon]|nr:hypothetical protein [Candidatus Methanomethylophilaceae archaeon]
MFFIVLTLPTLGIHEEVEVVYKDIGGTLTFPYLYYFLNGGSAEKPLIWVEPWGFGDNP